MRGLWSRSKKEQAGFFTSTKWGKLKCMTFKQFLIKCMKKISFRINHFLLNMKMQIERNYLKFKEEIGRKKRRKDIWKNKSKNKLKKRKGKKNNNKKMKKEKFAIC